jgi:hypothetical protein
VVSYTRLFLLTLLAVGTPLFLIFQGTMSFGLQIASATVLLAFLAIYVFSGRKPLPKPPKMPSVTIEDDDEPEELDLPAPVVEMDSVSDKREEKIRRSRGRVAAPAAPAMPMPPPGVPLPPPGAPIPAMPPMPTAPSMPPPMPAPGAPPAVAGGGENVARRLVVARDAQSEMESEIETYVEERRVKRAEIRGRIERRRRMALAERRAAKVRMWTELEDGEDLGALLNRANHGLTVIDEPEDPDDSAPLGVSYVRIDESRIIKLRIPLSVPEKQDETPTNPLPQMPEMGEMPPMPPPSGDLPPPPGMPGMPPPPPPPSL